MFNVAHDHQSPQVSSLYFAKSARESGKGCFLPETELARTPKDGKGLLVELMTSVEDVEVVSPSILLVVVYHL